MEPDDTLRDLLGLDLPPDRLAAVIAAYRDILSNLEALRALDLTDVHPAILFEPTAPYRTPGDAP
jgi:putative NADH-flavin reductase